PSKKNTMSLRFSSLALLLSLGLVACGGTIDAPAPAEDSPVAADAGSDAVDQEPGPDAGAAELGPHCNPFVPRGANTLGGCCPSGCAPLDPPEGDVYCVNGGTGDAC